MTDLSALWLPVLVSSVAVFVLSSIIHMLSPWHKSDYPKLANEEAVMDALRPFDIPPGDYMMPRPKTREDLKSAEFLARRERGPVAVFTIMPNGAFAMGKYLARWFVYIVVVSAFAACITASALPPGANDHSVFHFIGIAAFGGYALALWQMSIWYHRSWMTTIKANLDGIIYALATALIFTWFWPKA
jgi:hypothetical protein